MAAPFKKTLVKNVTRVGEKTTTDTLYWKNLETPITKKEFGPITHIEFSPVEPHSFAVTNSTRVQIYSSRSLQVLKTISRFHEVAYSGSYRNDGRLLIAGGDEGVVRLFDVEGRSLLRMFKGHHGSIRTCKFLKDNTRIFSGSDDNSMCVWDIPSEKDISIYKEHKDYVRCGVASAASQDIIVTGSYDHTVKMYDTRLPESVMTLDHGCPVESVLMFPSGGVFMSSGGNVVKVWDALAGGKLLTTLCDHHKQVMSMNFCSNYKRLLTASLDRHVKIYDVSTYQVVHTLDYPGSLLSVAVAPDDSLIVAGTAEGLVSLQKRKPEEEVKKKKKSANYKFTLQGKSHVPLQGDQVVKHNKKTVLAKYDKLLKKFEYSKALDEALSIRTVRMSPQTTVSVIQELARRGGLKIALAGRDERTLKYLMKFITVNVKNPKFHSVLLDLGMLILDMYSDVIGHSSALDTHLLDFKVAITHEVEFMKDLFQVMGQLDTLFAASQTDKISHSATTEPLKPSHTAVQAS